MTKSMTKFLCQKTKWVGNRNIKMYYPPALSWTELECDDALVAMRLDEGQSNALKDNSKGVEYCSSLHDMTERSHHVSLHSSAVSLNQPYNWQGDGPKRRVSEIAPSNEDRMDINENKGLVEMDKSHIVQVATCNIPPMVKIGRASCRERV